MAHRRLPAAAALLLLLIVPLFDVLACASARACAVAPCCASMHGCPMHRSDGSCRLRSCGDHGASLAQLPPAVSVAAATLGHPDAPVARVVRVTSNAPLVVVAPPEPPPPRHRV
ncbi:MAG TPA: hypothetical protein VJZ76_19135 [Thermoanaerobaculia bacterium]|nr:hypothetical protein [Thermoanaerobaculia bacterium]